MAEVQGWRAWKEPSRGLRKTTGEDAKAETTRSTARSLLMSLAVAPQLGGFPRPICEATSVKVPLPLLRHISLARLGGGWAAARET